MNGFFITAAIVAVICVIWWTVKSEKGAGSKTAFLLPSVKVCSLASV